MVNPPFYWYRAKRILSKRDPIFKKLVSKHNKGFLFSKNKPFISLSRAIFSQQISTKAADSIWLKFEHKCKKKISPKKILSLSNRDLRKIGLSRQKAGYLKNVAKCFINKSFDPKKIKKMNDEEAILYITKIKGLGPWTASMYLAFVLTRPDIFPSTDVGLLRGISKNYKVNYPPNKKFLNKISNLHKGYRTVFTWYMWKSIDSTEVEY